MFSILMPIYNGIEFIDDSVNSIINQTFTEWELIISINGHEKNSDVYNIAKKYESDKIKIYDLDTKGKSNTLNESLKYCKYEKICLLDVDDIWRPTKLEQQSHFINNYDVVGTYCEYFGIRKGKPELVVGHISPIIFKLFNPIINSSSCFNKKDAYWNSEYDSIEDYDMWLRLMTEGKTFYNINDILVYHRLHKSSSFNGTSKQEDLLPILMKKYFN